MVADAVPKGSAGAAMAIANGVGNLGGFLGPWMFGLLRGQSGGFNSSMMVGGGLYIMAGLLALFVQVRPDNSAKQETAPELVRAVPASPAP
jgi:ACS family glucarate transporter-like MFS transporter